jgi:hypothetical protein
VEGPWPHPAHDRAQLLITGADGNALDIAVFDIAGRLLQARQTEAHAHGPTTVMIDMTALGPGLFHCVIANGNVSRHRTLVVR